MHKDSLDDYFMFAIKSVNTLSSQQRHAQHPQHAQHIEALKVDLMEFADSTSFTGLIKGGSAAHRAEQHKKIHDAHCAKLTVRKATLEQRMSEVLGAAF